MFRPFESGRRIPSISEQGGLQKTSHIIELLAQQQPQFIKTKQGLHCKLSNDIVISEQKFNKPKHRINRITFLDPNDITHVSLGLIDLRIKKINHDFSFLDGSGSILLPDKVYVLGREKKHLNFTNVDSFGIPSDDVSLGVGDGITGGKELSTGAAKIAVETFLNHIPYINFSGPPQEIEYSLRETAEIAQTNLINNIPEAEENVDIGTTVSVGFLEKNKFNFVNIGNSSIFLYIQSFDRLIRLTLPHVPLRDELQSYFAKNNNYDLFGNPRQHADYVFGKIMGIFDSVKNMVELERYSQNIADKYKIHDINISSFWQDKDITSAIDAAPLQGIDFGFITVNSGDMILLCTKGLTNNINTEEIKWVLRRPDMYPQEKTDLLVQQAVDRGNEYDIGRLRKYRGDVSVIIAEVE